MYEDAWKLSAWSHPHPEVATIQKLHPPYCPLCVSTLVLQQSAIILPS